MASTVTYQVAGMSCGGCANKVKNNVSSLNGVENVNVDLSSGTVEVTFGTEASNNLVTSKIEELGYSVVK
ncbi:heavy-metal-associated domain-containing protein [Chungangia koreensis]|uniref:Heavy-metal-associated domain-containing protein n=1 Tax=Chungangia koreensis TaxID=752657 RepID=A0ABV8X972_9LACT